MNGVKEDEWCMNAVREQEWSQTWKVYMKTVDLLYCVVLYLLVCRFGDVFDITSSVFVISWSPFENKKRFWNNFEVCFVCAGLINGHDSPSYRPNRMESTINRDPSWFFVVLNVATQSHFAETGNKQSK